MLRSSTSISESVSIWPLSTSPGDVGLQADRAHALAHHLERNLLQVEDDVGGVFDHARNGAELVRHAFDAHRGDGGAFNRAQQHAPQPGADGGPESALERLRGEHAVPLVERFRIGDQPLWFLKSFEHICWLLTLLRIQFDDQLLVQLDLHQILALGLSEHSRLADSRGPLPASWGWARAPWRRARAEWWDCSCCSRELRSRRWAFTVNDGISTRRPFTLMWPCRTNWRACAREVPKPMR